MNYLNNKDFHRLQGQLAQWQELEIINAEQAGRIAALYTLRESRYKNVLMYFIALVLMASGISAIVAHNWDYLSPALRLGSGLLVLLPAMAYCYWGQRQSPLHQELGALAQGLALGPMLAIVAQVYQTQGSAGDFFRTWLLLQLPAVLLLRSRALMVLVQLLAVLAFIGDNTLPHLVLFYLAGVLTFVLGLYNPYSFIPFLAVLAYGTADYFLLGLSDTTLPLLFSLCYPLGKYLKQPRIFTLYGVLAGYAAIIGFIADSAKSHPFWGLLCLAVCLLTLYRDPIRLAFAALPALAGLLYQELSTELQCFLSMAILLAFAYQALDEQRLLKLNFALINTIIIAFYLFGAHRNILYAGITLLITGAGLLAVNVYLLRRRSTVAKESP